jgi:hypothetical protein
VNGTANLSTGGTLVIEVDDTTTPKNDKLVAVGNLNITDATLDVQATGTPGQSVYLIASYGTLTGTFAVENVPAGYEVDYNYNSTNQIALVSTNPDYDLWAQSFGLDPNNNGAPEFDADDDGLLNRQEYAFGLPPNSGAPASPIVQHLDKTSGKFRYTRRNPDLTGLNYTIQTSTTLQAGSWANDNGAIQQVVQTAGDVQTVEVTLGGTPPAVPRFFVRVAADE